MFDRLNTNNEPERTTGLRFVQRRNPHSGQYDLVLQQEWGCYGSMHGEPPEFHREWHDVEVEDE